MSRTLFLHIGLSKTGSTSIQKLLAAQRKLLLRNGVCYPSSVGDVSHNLLMHIALARSTDGKKLPRREIDGLPPGVRVDQAVEHFDQEMKSLPADVTDVIISAERCSIYLRTEHEVAQLQKLFAPYFDTIKVIVYLRRQDLHATSQYSQMLRRRTLEYPNLEELWPEFAAAYRYDTLLQKWGAVFGRDNLIPRIFERNAMLNGDAVQDFLSVCGLNANFAAERELAETNPSINPLGQSLLIELGLLLREQPPKPDAPEDERVWRRLSSTVTQLYTGRGWQPSRAQAAAFMEQFAEENEAVRATWFPERASLFDLDYSSLPEEPIDLRQQDVRHAALSAVVELARQYCKRDVAVEELRAKARAAEAKQKRRNKGKPEGGGKQALNRLVSVNGNNVPARLKLARHCHAAGDIAAARAHVEAALRAAPNNEAARAAMQMLERKAGPSSAAAAKLHEHTPA